MKEHRLVVNAAQCLSRHVIVQYIDNHGVFYTDTHVMLFLHCHEFTDTHAMFLYITLNSDTSCHHTVQLHVYVPQRCLGFELM